MAFTVAIQEPKTVYGNHKIHHVKITADGAEDAVDTGLGRIIGYALGHGSLTTGSPKIFVNQGTTGTAVNGFLGISGVANGDFFFVTVFGV